MYLRLLISTLLTLPVLVGCQHGGMGQDTATNTVAVCVVHPIGDYDAAGTIYFKQTGDKVQINGRITGLSPGKHGFHVHQYGDLSDREAGTTAGGHFDPTNQPHGRRLDAQRHVGDLGNILADQRGVAMIDKTDEVISLHGKHSIIGRSIIIHAGADKFVQPTGDAGPRAGGGVIGLAKPSTASGG